MKALFTRKTVLSICILMIAGLPWSCVKDHVDPNAPVNVTCSCQILDNSGPTGQFQTQKMDCPGGRFTCKCGDLAQRGGIVEFKCN